MYVESIKTNIQRLKPVLLEGESSEDILQKDILEDAFLASNLTNNKTNNVIYVIQENKIGLEYMDLTGRFPCQSSRGNIRMMVAYHYDGNAIRIKPLKNRQAGTIVNAWNKIKNTLPRPEHSRTRTF